MIWGVWSRPVFNLSQTKAKTMKSNMYIGLQPLTRTRTEQQSIHIQKTTRNCRSVELRYQKPCHKKNIHEQAAKKD